MAGIRVLLLFLSFRFSSSSAPRAAYASPSFHSLNSLPSFSCCQSILSPEELDKCSYSFDHDSALLSHSPRHQYKIAIVSYSTPNILNYSAYTHAINTLYSQHNGYYFRQLNQTNGQFDSEDERWNKIMILRSSLLTWARAFDYLIWIDADAIVLNFQFHFDDLIAQHPSADLIASSENHELLISNLFSCGGSANKINTGLIIVKNTQWSLDFLLSYWNHSDRRTYHDQTVFDFLYTEMERASSSTDITSHIVILPPAALNSNSPVSLWFKPDQPVLHLLGEHIDYRQLVFRNIFQSICSLETFIPSPVAVPSPVDAPPGTSTPPVPRVVSSPAPRTLTRQEINNIVLNVTAYRLDQWYLDTSYPLFLSAINLLTQHTETFKTLPWQQINNKINETYLPSLVSKTTHLSSRLAGSLKFSFRDSAALASPHLSSLSPDQFAEAFFLEPAPPAFSYHGADVLILKTYRTFRNLISSLRPLNERHRLASSSSSSPSAQQNITAWYFYLQMTSMIGGLYCSLPHAPGVDLLFDEVQDLYREVLSFPVAPVISPVSTRSTHLRGLASLQYHQLIYLKRQAATATATPHTSVAIPKRRRVKSLSSLSSLRLELEMEGNFIEAYETYQQLAGKYGSQGAWIFEAMLFIASCEVGKHQQAEAYYEKAKMSMQNLGTRDLSYGLMLKYRGECLWKMGRVEESEEALKESLRIHRLNDLPLSHVSYQHLYELVQLIRQHKLRQRDEVQQEGSSEL
jgi:tetratricopeptide (TPR) repeat protein